MEQLNDAMEKAIEDVAFEGFDVLNRQFHHVIHRKCGNSYLIERLQQSYQRLLQIIN